MPWVYPPPYREMVEKCTSSFCGAPNRQFFNTVTQELLEYLNQPGLTAEKLFEDFHDTWGSFYDPGVLGTEIDGEWLSWSIPKWRDMKTAKRLASCQPTSYTDILDIPRVGPDTFYDMFRFTLFRLILRKGVCLPVFRWFGLEGVDQQYFVITESMSGDRYYVKTHYGIPYDVQDDTLFVFPHGVLYQVRIAHPKDEFCDLSHVYQPSNLRMGTFRTDVTAEGIIKPISVETSCLRLRFRTGYFLNSELKLAMVRQKSDYWAGYDHEDLVNKRDNQCAEDTCKQFAFRKQEELEDPTVRGVTKPATLGVSEVTFADVTDGEYKALVYSDKGIVVATKIGIALDSQSTKDVDIRHTIPLPAPVADISAAWAGIVPCPRKKLLQGDIVRQYQRDTSNCGTFSIALAASYWNPLVYNPMNRNGKWVEDEHGDWPKWTWQETMRDVADRLGFSSLSDHLDKSSTTSTHGIRMLKQWIALGIPVIVNVDELQDTSLTKGEHYKMLVGYDDDALLHYQKDDGTEGSNRGALYFANPGLKGLNEGKPDKTVDEIPASRRENHDDYNNVPIGNDVDSYTAFWEKWRAGGVPLFTEDLWYLPFYPTSDLETIIDYGF